MGLLALLGQLQVALDYDDLITAARFDRISRAQVPYGQNDVSKKRHDFSYRLGPRQFGLVSCDD